MSDGRNISPEFHQNLCQFLKDFTFHIVADQPDDLISYGVRYFSTLQRQRISSTIESKNRSLDAEETVHESDENITNRLGRRNGRRESVSAERYDPSHDNIASIETHEKTGEQSNKIRKVLEEFFLFRGMEEDEIKTVIGAMKPCRISKGHVVIKQGEQGDFFYVVGKGVFHVIVEDDEGKSRIVKVYKESGAFGELALMYNEPRAATVVAVTDGLLWSMNGLTFRRLILRGAYEKRKRYERLLNSVPELSPLSASEREIVSDALLPKNFNAGEVICRQGDIGDGMYFVESGSVSVVIENTNSKTNITERTEISKIHPGGYFGELSLISRVPRAATVSAVTDTKVAFLDAGAVERLLGSCMTLLKKRSDQYSTSASPHEGDSHLQTSP